MDTNKAVITEKSEKPLASKGDRVLWEPMLNFS